VTTQRVLVVDDNEDHRFLMVRALRDVRGVQLEVETAEDGEEALDLVFGRGAHAGRALPHLIILDIKMPKVNGLEVLSQIKADPELKSIPIVVLTSSERPEDVDATYQLGGNCYVTKPSNGAGLRAGLRGIASFWTALASVPEPAR
jgi:CheY-like chemotaxis protein